MDGRPEPVGVPCVRAESAETPCIARHGGPAVSPEGRCWGCGVDPYAELAKLCVASGRVPPPPYQDSDVYAEWLRLLLAKDRES